MKIVNFKVAHTIANVLCLNKEMLLSYYINKPSYLVKLICADL